MVASSSQKVILVPEHFFITFLALVNTGRVIAEAGSMTTDLARGSNAVTSILAMLDRCTQITPEDSNEYRPDTIVGHIEFCEVDFAYPTRPDVMLFKGISISFEQGKSTALIGESGSGKSTIPSLIEIFYDPLNGVVKIDSRDIKSYHLGP